MMIFKLTLAFVFALVTAAAAQTDEIYRLTFSEATNFDIMNSLSHKQPKTILISNVTDAWDYTVFWNGFVGGETQEQIETETKTSRHESYDPEYLFRDPQMLKAISTTERKSLRKRTLKPATAKKIALKGVGYRTVSSTRDIKGFYVSSTEPLFTSDGQYAFIELLVFLKGHIEIGGRTFDDFGSVTIVYQKQADGKWKKFKKYDYLIL
ncbi:hypothetical protein [Dyadobacter fermentans]|uniref:hypothetical protein n=1 Tax=Dyadobacter fermentans TaxID=94254 RepID=UPI001CC1265B|nr:hypothetical protein [Dyadobacter fermentans]MBZ1357461.1 hypothetical protein [Dyadobacter fermentans]